MALFGRSDLSWAGLAIHQSPLSSYNQNWNTEFWLLQYWMWYTGFIQFVNCNQSYDGYLNVDRMNQNSVLQFKGYNTVIHEYYTQNSIWYISVWG